jgi:uncharacterized membrane protein YtjA (UPF0391 family)
MVIARAGTPALTVVPAPSLQARSRCGAASGGAAASRQPESGAGRLSASRGIELAVSSSTVREEKSMLYYAVVFLVIALIAGVFGFTGLAGTAANIAWILFVVGLVLALVFFIRGRGSSSSI